MGPCESMRVHSNEVELDVDTMDLLYALMSTMGGPLVQRVHDG